MVTQSFVDTQLWPQTPPVDTPTVAPTTAPATTATAGATAASAESTGILSTINDMLSWKQVGGSGSSYSYNNNGYLSYKNIYKNNDKVQDFFIRQYQPYDETRTYSNNNSAQAFKNILSGLAEMNYRSMWSAESTRLVAEQKQYTDVWRWYGFSMWRAPRVSPPRTRKFRSKQTVIW